MDDSDWIIVRLRDFSVPRIQSNLLAGDSSARYFHVVRITDLVEPYIDAVLGHDDATTYEQMRPLLFEHYYSFWTPRRAYTRNLGAATLRARREMIRSRLSHVSACFAMHGLELADLEVVLFVGQGTTNGHAFRENGRVVVWIPVEPYTDQGYTDVFLTHELAHALHYFRAPGFYFETAAEKDRGSRLLITEGLATCLTSVVLGITDEQALWGGYLDAGTLAAWMDQCERRYGEMCAFLLDNFDHDLAANHGLFCFYDSSDVIRSRGGYFVGQRLIRALVHDQDLTTADLLSLDRREFEDAIRKRLADAGA